MSTRRQEEVASGAGARRGGRRRLGAAALLASGLALGAGEPPSPAARPLPLPRLAPRAEAWTETGLGGIRGITLGPIENARHPGRGYGTAASGRAMDEARAIGATWVALTPFGRVWDLAPTGIDLTFEAPFEENRRDVLEAARQAHARGLKVMLVPHLWVETGGWRALIDPGDDEAWERWAKAYERFVLTWAEVAKEGGVELLSVGVELRSFVTGARAERFRKIIGAVRAAYPGLLTYSANWDDVEQTLIWDEVDLVGVNAFYPLAERDGASFAELARGGREVTQRLEALSRGLGKPILLTEVGYTTRADPAVRPWEWPDGMVDVKVDEEAQAEAYAAILAPFLGSRAAAGFFVWRYYADPDDLSQESEWGFSPRGKLAEIVLRDAFAARWASDGPYLPGESLGRHGARTPGVFAWELDAPGPR